MSDNTKDDVNNLAKISWACRRGMLELDVLLGNFLKTSYKCLNIQDKQLFVELLHYSDPELFAWLMNQELPSHPHLIPMIKKIQMHARTQFSSETL
jgi:antitoxin CptB